MAETVILTGPDGTDYPFPGVEKVSLRKSGGGRAEFGGGGSKYLAMINGSITAVTATDILEAGGLREMAFAGCVDLASVDLPSSIGLTSIPTFCFYDCRSLSGIALPSTVEWIEESAFESSGISTIDLSNVLDIGPRAFAYCWFTSPVIIADGAMVEDAAFLASHLSSITIGHGCYVSGAGTFSLCELVSFTMPADSFITGYFNDEGYLFSMCQYLTSVDLSVDSMANAHGWFLDCPQLTSITIRSDTVPEANAETFAGRLYGPVPSNCVISVKPNMVSAFRAADYWKDYTIQAIS